MFETTTDRLCNWFLSIIWAASMSLFPFASVHAQNNRTIDTCPNDGPPGLQDFQNLSIDPYLDRPDGITARATSVIEEALINKLLRQEAPVRLSKTYCQLSVTQMVVDFTWPIQDDAISHQSIRAIFTWEVSEFDQGWQLNELGKKDICVRQQNPDTGLCL